MEGRISMSLSFYADAQTLDLDWELYFFLKTMLNGPLGMALYVWFQYPRENKCI